MASRPSSPSSLPAAALPVEVPGLAPCVAVVGPANSGKTTLLHLLDRALQLHPEKPLVYVVKGNPDGTGRYLFHAPALREGLKPRVKGAWSAVTVETIAEWIERCRERLELVLVDVGGRHSESNRTLFGRCSHCLVVARPLADGSAEQAEGMESWVRAGREAGLEVLARVRSLWKEGAPGIGRGEGGGLAASFRADAAAPEDTLNRPVVERLAEELLSLRVHRGRPGYLDLRLPRDWAFADLADLAGLARDLPERVAEGRLLLGGRAPIWAYAAALHRALDLRPGAAVEVFDPKTPHGVVEVPPTLHGEPAPEAVASLAARWGAGRGDVGAVLELEITTADRFLPPGFIRHLPALPRPEGAPPAGPVVVSGAGPVWLHLAYSRWLRSLPGERRIGHADARTGYAVFVAGPGTPDTRPWELGPRARERASAERGSIGLFVRCGERYRPPEPEGGWRVITLPDELGPGALPAAVEEAREALRGHRSARVLIAGPVTLGVALGQGLAHEPVAIDYLQLNQVTKEYEVWVTNRRNL